MNKLSIAKRAQILAMLTEDASMRSVSRLADVSINTVSKLLEDAGRFCAGFHDAKVRGVKAKRVHVDEIWSVTGAKAKNVAAMKNPVDGAGDTWTWTAIEADTKLLIGHFVGGRDGECARWFMDDLASRLANRVQLTSDGHKAYLDAVEGAFGVDVDYGMLNKIYGSSPENAKDRYSPAECIGARKLAIEGKPDPKHISTSYAERANLTMRMHMRRFTRLTNAFSKKFENHAHMVAIYAVWYNWIRIHKSLRVTPAMASGLSETVMDWSDFVEMMDADTPKSGARGRYKATKQKAPPMGPYAMFVEYTPVGSHSSNVEPPVLLAAKTETEASNEAVAKANSLYPSIASNVLIRVVGSDGSGRPIAEIRRPISN